MNRGAWQATVDGVTKSETQLSDSHTHTHTHTHTRIGAGGRRGVQAASNAVLRSLGISVCG